MSIAMNTFLHSPVRSSCCNTARGLVVTRRLDIVNMSHSQFRYLSTKKPAYEGHIPLNTFEAAFLTVGSALMSLADVRRGGAQ